MKILSVTIIPPGENAQWWRIFNIARQLKSEHFEVEIVHYIPKGYKAHKKSLEKKIKDNNRSFIVNSPIVIPFKHLRKLTLDNYDLVYGNNTAGPFFSILGKLTKIPLIYDMHGTPYEYKLNEKSKFETFINKIMHYVALKYSDGIICVSKKMLNYFSKGSSEYNRFVYITNGVDLEFFKPLNTNRNNELKKMGLDKKLIFGYIGAFQKHQGVNNLINTASRISNKDTGFIIVGSDRYKKEENIIYIPKVNIEQVPYYYSLCDVLVLPRPLHIATEMAAPTKFAEYAAMGKPILTTDVGDAADFVRQYHNGIVVKNNHPDNLKKGIKKFLTLDENELIQMGKNSRKLAEHEFDWKKISKDLKKYLQEVISG